MIITLLIVLSSVQVFGQEINFKIENTKILQKINNNWQEFPKFAAVNFGVTKPGYQPGQVILDYDDYMHRFKQLEIMGINVIRVYALLSPEFYKALNEWNANPKHTTIYVLHGTAFPEFEMEHNNGTSAFDEEITRLMKLDIQKAMVGVYGGGKFPYKYDYSNGGKKPIYGEYNFDISKYLIGWVVSGEISPYCINRTNGDVSAPSEFQGKYFESLPTASKFEVWVAQMFEYLAEESIIKYNKMAPISHTNWVTTDGMKHSREPRFDEPFDQAAGEIDYSSVEDWQEFDIRNIKVNLNTWEAGKFYNQHAYPYYPEMIKLGTQDPFKEYLQQLKGNFSDLPLIITEFGLPTSHGISAFERTFGRTHGFLTEKDQGDRMYTMMKMMTDELDMNGVVIFQMNDEWFKRSWNTKEYEINRQQWKNVLTSEQYFGMFDVTSHPDLRINQEIQENDFYKVTIENNYEFVSLDIDLKRPLEGGSEIMVGIDMMPAGVKEWFGTNFDKEIDAYMLIKEDSVEFFVSSDYDSYKKRYGQWLEPDIYTQDYFNHISFGTPKMLVKVPTKALWLDPNCDGQKSLVQGNNLFISQNKYLQNADRCYIGQDKHNNNELVTYYEAQIFAVPFNNRLVTRGEDTIKINIPYQLLGYSDPSSHTKTFMTGFGKQFQVSHQEYKTPLNFQFTYRIGTEFKESKMNMDFTWKSWGLPEFWVVKPKENIDAFRMAFHEINFGLTPQNLTLSQIQSMTFINKTPTYEIIINVHYYLVKTSVIMLIVSFMMASAGKILGRFGSYCYSAQNIQMQSYRLMIYNFLAGLGLIVYLAMDVEITFVVSNSIYYLYILLIIWDSLILLGLVLFNKWNLQKECTDNFDEKEHAFVIACHNSSDVLESTIKSLLTRVSGSQIYVADNGSTEKEQELSREICENLNVGIHYGHIVFDTMVNGKMIKRGNKTMAQYAAVCSLDSNVKYVTCIDDDTRLDPTWNVNKVIKYFKDDDNVVVLAYPLTADNPQYDIEWFQAMEYLVTGFFKIFHSKVYSTIFNSGAFGTYKVEILKEAFVHHNTDYHGDDLQICMNIHQLKGKKFYHNPTKTHTQNYKVKTATNMVGTTIVPKCWLHLSSISKCFDNNCDCGNPDLLQQRSKGWFVSKHQFIPKYIKMIFNVNGVHGLWVRFVAFYELIMILNEYFAIFYIIFFLENFGLWLLEGFLIGYAFTVLVMTLFNWTVLRPNKQYIPYEVITIQPLIYKLFMITIYRYLGLFYNLFVYSIQHKSGTKIKKRMEDKEFKTNIQGMYEGENSRVNLLV